MITIPENEKEDSILDKLQYNSMWQGAFVGADAVLTFCDFGVHAGYEYHIPRWSAEWLLRGKDVRVRHFPMKDIAQRGMVTLFF